MSGEKSQAVNSESNHEIAGRQNGGDENSA